MVLFVRRGQHLGLVNVIHTQLFENARLHKMPNAALGHHRNGHGIHDSANHLRIGHPRHATLGANLRRHALQRHHSNRASILSNLGLLDGDHIHNDAALQHFCKADLEARAGVSEIGVPIVLRHVALFLKPEAVRPGRRVRGCVPVPLAILQGGRVRAVPLVKAVVKAA